MSFTGLPRGCFAGETRVLTPTGSVRIDTIKAGQSVLSWNQATGSLVERSTSRVLRYDGGCVIELFCMGKSAPLLVTKSHTLLTQNGWREVRKIKLGDELFLLENAKPVLTSVVGLNRREAKAPVYNLHTRGEHNFVADGVVSHNFTNLLTLRTILHQTAERITDLVKRETLETLELGWKKH